MHRAGEACHRLPGVWVVACQPVPGAALAGLAFRLWTEHLVSAQGRFASELQAAKHCPGWAWKRSVDSEVVLDLPAVVRLMPVEGQVWQGWAWLVRVWLRLQGRLDVVVVTSVLLPLLQASEVVT